MFWEALLERAASHLSLRLYANSLLRVSPVRNGCTLVTGMLGLGAAGGLFSSRWAGSFSDWEPAAKLPSGLTFRVLGVSTAGRSSSVTDTTSISAGSGCCGAPVSGS